MTLVRADVEKPGYTALSTSQLTKKNRHKGIAPVHHMQVTCLTRESTRGNVDFLDHLDSIHRFVPFTFSTRQRHRSRNCILP